jgi:hypothetical protein
MSVKPVEIPTLVSCFAHKMECRVKDAFWVSNTGTQNVGGRPLSENGSRTYFEDFVIKSSYAEETPCFPIHAVTF